MSHDTDKKAKVRTMPHMKPHWMKIKVHTTGSILIQISSGPMCPTAEISERKIGTL
jgi:hypothetical protein